MRPYLSWRKARRAHDRPETVPVPLPLSLAAWNVGEASVGSPEFPVVGWTMVAELPPGPSRVAPASVTRSVTRARARANHPRDRRDTGTVCTEVPPGSPQAAHPCRNRPPVKRGPRQESGPGVKGRGWQLRKCGGRPRGRGRTPSGSRPGDLLGLGGQVVLWHQAREVAARRGTWPAREVAAHGTGASWEPPRIERLSSRRAPATGVDEDGDVLGHMGINVPDLGAAAAYYSSLMPLLAYEPFLTDEDAIAFMPAEGKRGAYLFFYEATEDRPYAARPPACSTSHS